MAMGDLTYVDKQVSRCVDTLWPLGALSWVRLVYLGSMNMIQLGHEFLLQDNI